MSEPFRKQPSAIMRKAQELFRLIDAFSQTINEEDLLQKERIQLMKEDSFAIAPKIAGADAVDLYDIKMQNAALIRKHAMDLFVTIGSFRFDEGKAELKYIELIREEIEEFRLLFVDWVNTFDPWDYVIDRWGMFNPPGVSAHDKDPDEDLPFDGFDV
jgi:hypothetical protein